MPFHSHSLETSGKVCQFQQPGHTLPFNLQQSQNNYTCAPWGNLKLRTPPDLSPLTFPGTFEVLPLDRAVFCTLVFSLLCASSP